MYNIKQIIQIVRPLRLQVADSQDFIKNLLLDSRKLGHIRNTLFFAIQGKNHDGHNFVENLYEKGIRNFIVEKEINYELLPNANILLVEDSVKALQDLAGFHRQQFYYPVVAITGSNGKTIIKEWLSQVLQKLNFSIVRSPKSYNSQIGVPLSLWQMSNKHNLAIIEAGISQPNEMQKLAQITQPSIGILTNIGTAHDENFETQKEKLKEKLKLFEQVDCLIYSKSQDLIQHKLENYQKPRTLSWTTENTQNADIQIIAKNKDVFYTYQNQKNKLTLKHEPSKAELENLLHILSFLLYLKISAEKIQEVLSDLQPIQMRMTWKEGINNNYLLDDSYNNDLVGLEIALDALANSSTRKKKVVILSDILESGLPSKALYTQVNELLVQRKIDELIGVGENITSNKKVFRINARFIKKLEVGSQEPEKRSQNKHSTLAAQYSVFDNLRNSLILVKGARKFQFEKIAKRLERKSHQTVLEINLDALVHNLNFYRNLLKSSTKIMVMVKAYAYGSGLVEVASLLQFHGVDYLAVAYTDEGVLLRQNGIHLPIMVLNPNPNSFEQLFEYNLEPELYNFQLLEEFLNYYYQYKNYELFKVHLNLDTGMKRLGFELEEKDKLLQIIAKEFPYHLQIASVFSHLAGADEAKHCDFSKMQIQKFNSFAKAIEDVAAYSIIKHILNSPGMVRFPEAHFDMVRLGVGLYGIETNNLYQNQLQAIGTLKTYISQIKALKKGETVGYGRKGIAQKDMKIATIAIGYADGFNRSLSNSVGKVWIHNQPAPVIGNICMDMTMVDISDVSSVSEGDEVIIFSPKHSIIDMANQLDTIPYEILTSISERVKRVFYQE